MYRDRQGPRREVFTSVAEIRRFRSRERKREDKTVRDGERRSDRERSHAPGPSPLVVDPT